MALPHLHEHSRSSAVSTASTEHGASTGTWEGTPYCGEPPGRVQPRLDTWLALHGWRRCIWAPVSQRGTPEALPQGGLRLVLIGDA